LGPVRRIYGGFGACLLALCCTLQTAHSAGLGGTIDGTLAEKTPGAQLQAGTTAYLYKLTTGQDPQQVATADVDGSGHFTFDFLETDPANAYEVGVQYQGAPYFSDKITFAPGETSRQVSLSVYEPSDDDSVLSLASTSLLVDADDKTHDLVVLELDSFVNGSQQTFVPNTTPRNGGPPPLLRFSLPPNATDLTAGSGMTPDEIIQIGTGFGALAPLPPGRQDVSFSYRAAYQTSSLTFSKSVIYPTASVRVLMPVGGGRVDSPQLTRQGVQSIGGRQFDLLAASNMPAGSKVELRFSALPGVSPLAFLTQPEALPWLAAMLALVVLGLLGWYVWDRRHKPAEPPVVAPDRHTLEVERRELLVALARLDDRYDEGKIDAEDYRTQRDAQKSELRDLMLRIEASAGAEAHAAG
jgi:hypothetical protein